MTDPRLKKKNKKPALSNSRLNMLFKCGAQYDLRYNQNIKKPPGIFLVVGRAVDHSVNYNLQRRLDGLDLCSVEEISDVTADVFNREWATTELLFTKEETEKGVKRIKGEAHDKSIRLGVLHSLDFAPSIFPTYIQRDIRVTLQGFPFDLTGIIDVQEGTDIIKIRDTKTTYKSPPKDVAEKDEQLTIYSLMVYKNDGKLPRDLCLDYLIDTSTPEAKTYRTHRSLQDFKPLLKRIEVAAEALTKGVFLPARETDWWCDPRWCGYYPCKYVRGNKLQKPKKK